MKKILLLSILLTAGICQQKAVAQCAAPLTITSTGNPGEVEFEYDLNGVANPAGFYGEISIYNTTTMNWFNNVYINQGNNPLTYTFTENGTYDITSLTMDTMSSCIDTIQYTYDVTGVSGSSCNADFTIFNDSLSTTSYYGYNYSTGTNLSYSWDFGDGGSSTDQFPVHTFLTTGTFNVCLTIDDGNGCVDTHCDSIIVYTKASQTTISIYDPSTASITESNVINEVSVYPNPSNGNFTLSFNSTAAINTNVSILNMQGMKIMSKNVESNNGVNSIKFDLNDLASGVYFWHFENGTTGKFIIE